MCHRCDGIDGEGVGDTILDVISATEYGFRLRRLLARPLLRHQCHLGGAIGAGKTEGAMEGGGKVEEKQGEEREAGENRILRTGGTAVPGYTTHRRHMKRGQE